LLLGSGQVAFDRRGKYPIVGELAFTGETRPVKVILSMAIWSVAEGRDGLLVPTAIRTASGWLGIGSQNGSWSIFPPEYYRALISGFQHYGRIGGGGTSHLSGGWGGSQSNVPFPYRACRLATSSQKTHCDGFLYSSGARMKDEDRRCKGFCDGAKSRAAP
jgi:hypothetical protein